MNYRLRQSWVMFLCSALVWTGGDLARAALLLKDPAPTAFGSYHHFLMNEERMRLETEAMASRFVTAIDPIAMGANRAEFPFLLRLLIGIGILNRSRILMDHPDQELFPQFPRWRTWQNVVRELLWAGAGLAVAWGLSHTLALLKGQDGMLLACGINWAAIRLRLEEMKIPRFTWGRGSRIPKELTRLALDQLAISLRRGGHAVGETLVVKYRGKDGRMHLKLIIAKAVVPERGDPLKLTQPELERQLRKELRANANLEYPVWLYRGGHGRLSTGSNPAIKGETHPFAGELTRRAIMTVWNEEKQEREEVEENVEIILFHNGNKDGIYLNGEFIPTDELKTELDMTMANPERPDAPHPSVKLKGDTPVAARELALRRAKGDAYAAMRLARRMKVSREQRMHPPSPALIEAWAGLFRRVVDATIPINRNLDTLNKAEVAALKAAMVKAFAGQADAWFGRQADNKPFWIDGKRKIPEIISYAVDAYLHNDLNRALRSFARDAVTSFGLESFSTVDPNPVFLSDQLGLSMARGRRKDANGRPTREWTRQAANSSSRALAIAEPGGQPGEFAYEQRLDLDYTQGLVVEPLPTGALVVWSKRLDRELTPQEVEKLWFNLAESPFIAVAQPNDPNHGLERDMARITHYARLATRIWNDPRSPDRLVSTNIENRFLEWAKREDRGELVPGQARLFIVGFHGDSEHGKLTGSFLREALSNLGYDALDGNEDLENPKLARETYRLGPASAPDTLGLIFDTHADTYASGQTQPAWLREQISHLFAITGGEDMNLDNGVARTLGQNMVGTRLAGNTITIGCPWAETNARVIDPINHFITEDYLILRILLRLREAYPNPDQHPLGLRHTREELLAMWKMVDRAPELLAPITGFDANIQPVASETVIQEKLVAKVLGQDISEPRRVKYLYRFAFLAPSLYITYRFLSQGPGIFVSWMFGDGELQVIAMVVAALVWYAAGHLLITAILRLREHRTLFRAQGGAQVGISDQEAYHFDEDVWTMTFAQAYPEAKPASIRAGAALYSVERNFVKTVRPTLDSRGWVLNAQGDNRTVFDPEENTRIQGARMGAMLTRVDNDGVWPRLALWLRAKFSTLEDDAYSTLARPRAITVGYNWKAPEAAYTWKTEGDNAENYGVRLPTVAFPLPAPLGRFLDEFTARTGVTFTDEQRATFFEMTKKVKNEPAKLAYEHGGRMAVALGVPHDLVDGFANAYRIADGELFTFSAEDTDSYNRIARFRDRRFLPIGHLASMSKLALESALEVQPKVIFWKRWPMGLPRNLALIDSTDSPVGSGRLIKDMVGSDILALYETEVTMPTEMESRVSADEVDGPLGSVSVYRVELTAPYVKLAERARQLSGGVRLMRPRLELNSDMTLVIPVVAHLQPLTYRLIAKKPAIRLVFHSDTGEGSVKIPLESLPNGRWRGLTVPGALLEQFGISLDRVKSLDLIVINAEGTLLVDADIADHAQRWVHQPTVALPGSAPAVAPLNISSDGSSMGDQSGPASAAAAESARGRFDFSRLRPSVARSVFKVRRAMGHYEGAARSAPTAVAPAFVAPPVAAAAAKPSIQIPKWVWAGLICLLLALFEFGFWDALGKFGLDNVGRQPAEVGPSAPAGALIDRVLLDQVLDLVKSMAPEKALASAKKFNASGRHRKLKAALDQQVMSANALVKIADSIDQYRKDKMKEETLKAALQIAQPILSGWDNYDSGSVLSTVSQTRGHYWLMLPAISNFRDALTRVLSAGGSNVPREHGWILHGPRHRSPRLERAA